MLNNGPAKGNVTGNLDYFHYAPGQSVDMFATCQQCFPFFEASAKAFRGFISSLYFFMGSRKMQKRKHVHPMFNPASSGNHN